MVVVVVLLLGYGGNDRDHGGRGDGHHGGNTGGDGDGITPANAFWGIWAGLIILLFMPPKPPV